MFCFAVEMFSNYLFAATLSRVSTGITQIRLHSTTVYIIFVQKEYLQYALGGDGLGDGAGDGLGGVDESFLTGHALFHVSAEETLHDGVDGTEKDTTLAIDIGLQII
jgi:hypothetical protein